jgi:hypothetical protein
LLPAAAAALVAKDRQTTGLALLTAVTHVEARCIILSFVNRSFADDEHSLRVQEKMRDVAPTLRYDEARCKLDFMLSTRKGFARLKNEADPLFCAARFIIDQRKQTEVDTRSCGHGHQGCVIECAI